MAQGTWIPFADPEWCAPYRNLLDGNVNDINYGIYRNENAAYSEDFEFNACVVDPIDPIDPPDPGLSCIPYNANDPLHQNITTTRTVNTQEYAVGLNVMSLPQ